MRFVLLVLFLFSLCVHAQHFNFEQVGSIYSPSSNIKAEFLNSESYNFELFDLDNDGDLDAFILSDYAQNRLYENTGGGNYIEKSNSVLSYFEIDLVESVDIDLDGDIDLITGVWNDSLTMMKIFLNDGTGSFSAQNVTWSWSGANLKDFLLEDTNGDGSPDILIFYAENSVLGCKVFINNGGGSFTYFGLFPYQKRLEKALFDDVDNDNDQDLLVYGMDTNFDYSLEIFRNDGSGALVRDSSFVFPELKWGSFCLIDIVNDGSKDLLYSGQTDGGDKYMNIYANYGNAEFDSVSSYPGLRDPNMTTGDFNSDGFDDIIMTGRRLSSNEKSCYKCLNDGSGGIECDTVNELQNGLIEGKLELFDADMDGDLDLIQSGQSNEYNLHYYLNFGGQFEKIVPSDFPFLCGGDVDFVDIDNDNDIDIVVSGQTQENEQVMTLFKNDGWGAFYKSLNNNLPNYTAIPEKDFADVDNDGDQDFVIVGSDSVWNNYETALYLNDGAGYFVKSQDTFIEGTAHRVKFFDMDNDSDMDLFVSVITQPGNQYNHRLYENTGNGSFVESGELLDTGVYIYDICIEDVDVDGDSDLFVAWRYDWDVITRTHLFRNYGGHFVMDTTSNISAGVRNRSADINGDGYPDLIQQSEYNPNSSNYCTTYIALNDGGGNLSYASSNLYIECGDFILFDADNDDDIDLWSSIFGIYENDGNGQFTLDSLTGVRTFNYYSEMYVVDIQGDQDIDVAIIGQVSQTGGCEMILYKNQTIVNVEESTFQNELKAYPNPSSNDVTIEFGTHVKKAQVKIISISGQIVHQENFKETNTVQLTLPESNGVYFIELMTESGERSVVKVVKN